MFAENMKTIREKQNKKLKQITKILRNKKTEKQKKNTETILKQ